MQLTPYGVKKFASPLFLFLFFLTIVSEQNNYIFRNPLNSYMALLDISFTLNFQIENFIF